MDELDAVRAFRADAPEPSAESRANALSALEHKMTSHTGNPRRRHFGFVRVLIPMGIAAVILVAVALATPIFGVRDQQGSAAARELHSLANVAAQRTDTTVLSKGMYAYTRSENLQMNTVFSVSGGPSSTTLVSFTREIWIGGDGSGRIHQVSQDSSGSRNMDQQFGPGELTLPLDTNGFTEEELMSLAQDPNQLAQVIRSRAAGTKNPVDQESFVLVGDLLRESDAPAQIRSALFQVAAGIPGVELVGNVDDPAGRPGISVAKTYKGIRSELIFDPETSMLLAERRTIVAPIPDLHFPIGTVIGATTYLSSGIVSSTTATP